MQSIAAGARLLLGGHPLEGDGGYYAPSVLADVAPGMAAFDQELFGPVAALSVARDAEHAIELANQSEFGLSRALRSRDEAHAERLAARMETGAVFINGFTRACRSAASSAAATVASCRTLACASSSTPRRCG